MDRAWSMFAAAGACGVTFVLSSGDYGALVNSWFDHPGPISVSFPASCPYVLTVKTTTNLLNKPVSIVLILLLEVASQRLRMTTLAAYADAQRYLQLCYSHFNTPV
jgi:hypothetical protein